MKNIKFISQFAKGHRYKLLVMLFATLLYVMVILVNPLVLQFTIDTVIANQEIKDIWGNIFSLILGGVSFIRNNLWILAVFIVVLNVLSGIAIFLRVETSGSLAENFTANLRNKVYDHLQHLPYAYHVSAKTGDLIQRCTSDIDQISRFLSLQVRELAYAIIMVVFALAILFSINVTATLVTMIAFPIIFVFAYVFFKKMQATFKKSDEAEAALSDVFQESLSAVRVVKAFNRERFELEKFDEKNRDFRDKTTHLIWLLALYWGISDVICFFQILGVLVFSIFSVRSGSMSIGDAVVFTSYVSMVLWPIRNVGRILSDMGKVGVSIDRLQEILNEEPESLDEGIEAEIKGHIVFDNVTFKYADDEFSVLNGISFEIMPGETVAIMGPTGSGKSSMVHLLTRLYDADSGRILIDGVDITKISRRYLREHVGIVLQEPYLFSKTILDNIRIAKPASSQEEVYGAAQVASIHDVIQGFDRGYETLVGEKGVTLSGGQKQRVAIARTVLNKQPIVIFDDSLSALDSETDASIRSALRNNNDNATTLIITHRVNSAQNADKIVVVYEGKVVQIGTHASLIQEEGLYQRIAKIQSHEDGGEI